ncbi:AI-2E family transporter [Halegenticoccus soli]|uniref:AI-2E family transporter n=1 Tax=Halegenticoccus soli TaxID=1985678 RepID=UPI000C6E70C4|nr:AI-2E family transporter [Halegenticoccus soli]
MTNVRVAFAAVLVAVLTLGSALVLRPFLTYLLAAALLAFVLYPLHRRLAPAVGERLSAGGLVAFSMLALVAPLAAFLNAALNATPRAPDAFGRAPIVRRTERTLEGVLGIEVSLGAWANAAIDQASDVLANEGSTIAGAGLHALFGVLLLIFVLYYLLKDGEQLVSWTKYATPLPRPVQEDLHARAERMTWAVIKGHVFVAIVQAIVAGVGLFAVGIPNAGFWTLVMTFLALLPIVGVGAVLGPAVVYLFVLNRVVAAALLALYGATIVALIDDYLRAILIDRGSTIHSAVILVGVFGGVYVLGPMGLFFAPILLGLFKSTIEVFDDHYEVLERP